MNASEEQITEAAPEPEVTVRLSLSRLNVVLNHLCAGRYADVADTVHCITGQVNPQLLDHQQRAVLAVLPVASEQRN